MKRVLSGGGSWCLMVAAVLSGCASRDIRFGEKASTEAECPPALTEIEYPLSEIEPVEDLIGSGAPRTIRNSERHDYWDMSLEDAIHLALRHSKVMRDLGGKVLRAPESVPTAMDPAIQETDPRYGVEAALSAFDAQFSTSLFTEQNDRRLNNQYLGTEGFFTQTFDVFQTEVAKRSVTGSEFSVRHGFDFDRNSNKGNQFQDGAWNTVLEGEFRHSLLQGGGVDFNRIAGPGSTPGVYNGVLVARVRTDVSLADFQIGLRDLVCDVENAYWDLYFAYRDLDTKVRARDASLSTWRRVDALHRSGKKGGELEKEAQAREQYYRFEADAQNALMGRPLEGTRTHNGSRPGTFRPTPGVYSAERRLRLLIGLPPNEELVIRPLDEPPAAPSSFDWYSVASEALGRRPELRRQQWKVKARELELAASRNYLLPDLDIVGRYRWRGFGEDLLDPNRSGTRFDAYSELTSGDFQEWQLGMEMSLPIGFRQGHTSVRNAQFRLSRARCLLLEQKRQVLNDLSGAVSEVDRAYHLLETNINRAHAAEQQMKVLQALYEEAEKVEFFVVLDAQRRYVEALRLYYQSRVEYALALRNVHFERGVLLDYCQLWLAEGSWPQKAYSDAARREHRRGHPKAIDYRIRRPPIIASGYTSMPSIVVPEVPPEQSPPENGPTEALLIPDSPHAERIPGPLPTNSQADQPQRQVLALPPSQRPSRFARDGTGPSRSVNTSRVVPLPPVQVAVRPDGMSSLR